MYDREFVDHCEANLDTNHVWVSVVGDWDEDHFTIEEVESRIKYSGVEENHDFITMLEGKSEDYNCGTNFDKKVDTGH